MLRKKGPQKPEFAYDIVRIHYLIIYTGMIEYKIAGDAKAPLLRCFIFMPKLKAGDVVFTIQYMNGQTSSTLKLKPLLKIFFLVLTWIWETRNVKNILVPSGISRIILMFRKTSTIQF